MTAPADLHDPAPPPVSVLTVRAVKCMLTRAGVDYSALTITEDPAIWTDLDAGVSTTSVEISGPKAARMEAFHALLDRGLSCAPYTDKHCYSRKAR